MKLFKIFSVLLFLALIATPGYAAKASTDTGYLGNDQWQIQSDGDIVPLTDSAMDLGASGSEVDNIYVDSIWIGGTEYTSLSTGSDGNWTGDGLTTTLDAAPTKFIATHSSGDFFATGFTVGTGDFTFANGAKLDGDTANEIRFIENSDTFKMGFSGNDITFDCTDGGVIFALTDATDGTVDLQTNNDTDDYIQISTSSNQPLINFVGCNGKITAASGTIDFDNEILTTTGTLSAGATTVTSLIIGDDVFDVITDDEFRVASNDAGTTFEVYATGAGDTDATISLIADASGDNGDEWDIVSDGGTNSILFQNDTSGSQATIMTLANTGAITTTGDIVIVNDSSTTNAVQDVLTVRSSTTGTAAAGLGVGIEFDVEDAGGIEQQGSIDVALTTVTDGSEDADIIFSTNNTGTIGEGFRLVGDSSATTGSYAKITQVTTETDAVLDALVLANSTGTATTGSGIGISFQPEDATGSEEQASMDVVFTDATRATADVDFVFRQNVAGAIEERVRFDADLNTILLTGTLPTLMIGDAGEEDAKIVWDGNAADFSFGLDDSGDGISLSLGTALGTTEVFKADGTTLTVTDALTVNGAVSMTSTVAISGVATITADPIIGGTTPLLTIGDAGAEDAAIVFDGNAYDFHVGLDDSADTLVIGVGSVLGTTPAIGVDADADVHLWQDLVIDKTINFAADAESTDSYVIALQDAPAAYTTGMFVVFTATTANTGSCDVNVNSLGEVNLKSLNNQDPADNYIEAGSVVWAVYDGTYFQILQPDANP